jgi:hypothetical protein
MLSRFLKQEMQKAMLGSFHPDERAMRGVKVLPFALLAL